MPQSQGSDIVLAKDTISLDQSALLDSGLSHLSEPEAGTTPNPSGYILAEDRALAQLHGQWAERWASGEGGLVRSLE